MTRTVQTKEERTEAALEALGAALDEYVAQPQKDIDLGLVFDLTTLLTAQTAQAEKIKAEHTVLNLDDRHAFYLDNYYEARQGIITKLVDAAASIAREYPYRPSTMFTGEEYVSRATTILKEVAYVQVNTRADLLVQYAHRIDMDAAAQENQA